MLRTSLMFRVLRFSNSATSARNASVYLWSGKRAHTCLQSSPKGFGIEPVSFEHLIGQKQVFYGIAVQPDAAYMGEIIDVRLLSLINIT